MTTRFRDRRGATTYIWAAAVAVCAALSVGLPGVSSLGALGAQTPSAIGQNIVRDTSTAALTLTDAVTIAKRQSQTIRIARNGVRRASGQQYQARSAFLPQLNASANYTRTLKSQYEGAFGSGGADTSGSGGPAPPAAPCDQYILDAAAATPDRVAGLEAYARCSAASSGGLDFSNLPFGQANAYTLGLSASQNLFTGGRASGQLMAANAGRRAADIELGAQEAQLTLDVTQAYYDAALADRLLSIAQASLAQSEETYRQAKAQQEVGNSSEFDLLRATVARDNQRPVVIQRQSDRDVAYLRLKQLLNLPLDQRIALATAIEDSTALPPGVSLAAVSAPDTASFNRATVREAAENVTAQQGLLRVARAQRFPTLQLSSSYGGVAYPSGGLPGSNDFRANWTVTLASSFALFSGGRIRGDEMVAQANLRDARDRLEQTREFAALDARVALNNVRQAQAALDASRGTASQAQRAYSIAEVRYKEGLSTQLELTDARNLLAQALANQALAARNLLVARVKLALLPNLPLTQGTGQAAQASQNSSTQSQTQTQDTTSQATNANAATSVTGTGF